MVFHWCLSDTKSPQVSRILLSILAVLNNAVVWIVSSRLPTSKSSKSFNNPLLTEPKAPITISIIVTFMLHSFSNSLAKSRYSSFFSHSFSFILWSAGRVFGNLVSSLLLKFLTYQFICPSAFFRRFLSFRAYTDVWTEPIIWITGGKFVLILYIYIYI